MKKEKTPLDFKLYKNFNFSSFDFHLDTPIYRYFSLKYLISMIKDKKLYLAYVNSWEDVYENWLLDSRELKLSWKQREEIPDAFGQCWTVEEESDAMWRIYSNIEKHKDGLDGKYEHSAVRVKTTPRKLLKQLLKNQGYKESTFISPVKYLDRNGFMEKRKSIINKYKCNPQEALLDSFFIKRKSFEHEKEVRVIVLSNNHYYNEPLTPDISPNALFDEYVIDPRICRKDYYLIRQSLLDLSIPERKIKQSELYQLDPYPNVLSSNTVPKTKKILQEIIRMRMIRDGYNCDLNDIQVRQLNELSFLFENKDEDDILSKFNGDISKWDVSNIKDMSWMFADSVFNGDISKWNVSNVENMFQMFMFSQFEGDISKWDVSNVKDMAEMFFGSRFNGDISKWDVSKVKDMSGMFAESVFNGDISKWDVSNVEDMGGMFDGSLFGGDISGWKKMPESAKLL